MSLTADVNAPVMGDTTLPSEIKALTPFAYDEGLITQKSTYAHTDATNQYSMTTTFEVKTTDVIPVSPAKVGVGSFRSHVAGATSISYPMQFQTQFPAILLDGVGQQITVQDTVSM